MLGTIAIIYLLSLINNWFVQLGYYLAVRSRNPQAFDGQKTLLEYWTGVVGDGFIAPLINIFIYIVIVNTRVQMTSTLLVLSFVGAVMLDMFTHYMQAKQSMTNWSMPVPGQWNGAGKWHMVSFSLQVTYFIIYLYIVVSRYKLIIADQSSLISVASTVVLALLFLCFFWVDYRK